MQGKEGVKKNHKHEVATHRVEEYIKGWQVHSLDRIQMDSYAGIFRS